MASMPRLVLPLVMVLVAGASVLGQEDAPPGPALPFEDYMAQLEESAVEGDAPLGRLGPQSGPAEIATAIGESLALVASDLDEFREIAPASCYAAAHEENLAYRSSLIELTESVLPRIADAESIEEVFGIIEEVDAKVHARHPIAYIEPPTATVGFGHSYRNIVAHMATCELAADDDVAVGATAQPEDVDPLGSPARSTE